MFLLCAGLEEHHFLVNVLLQGQASSARILYEIRVSLSNKRVTIASQIVSDHKSSHSRLRTNKACHVCMNKSMTKSLGHSLLCSVEQLFPAVLTAWSARTQPKARRNVRDLSELGFAFRTTGTGFVSCTRSVDGSTYKSCCYTVCCLSQTGQGTERHLYNNTWGLRGKESSWRRKAHQRHAGRQKKSLCCTFCYLECSTTEMFGFVGTHFVTLRSDRHTIGELIHHSAIASRELRVCDISNSSAEDRSKRNTVEIHHSRESFHLDHVPTNRYLQ